MSSAHKLMTVQAVQEFALAGNATITLLSLVTMQRFTYRIRQPEEAGPHFVGVLRGQDNESDFQFMGTIFKGPHMAGYFYRHGRSPKIGKDSLSAKAFIWFWEAMRSGRIPDKLEIWHEGKCGRCGRKLTVPSSIESGLGPECSRLMLKAS